MQKERVKVMKNYKLQLAITRLAEMHEGWSLLADTLPKDFIDAVTAHISALEAKCSDLEQQLASMTAERDSESRWAKQYHDEAVALRNRLAMALDTIQMYKQEICDE